MASVTDARLGAALDRIREVFGGMATHPEESNCECHWGGPEEVALLRTPDAPLDPDLLYRTWHDVGWRDDAALVRRLLPQVAEVLVEGWEKGLDWSGLPFWRAKWRDWPGEQADAVREFLHAWWAHTLETDTPPYPAHEVFDMCATASGTVTPWLAQWEVCQDPVADRHLLEVVECWIYDLGGDKLPNSWWCWDDNATAVAHEMNTWLAHHAVPRLSAQNADPDLVQRVRRLGLPLELRWDENVS
ncbi:hypothetical protein [Streptomyces sp. NPDC002537]